MKNLLFILYNTTFFIIGYGVSYYFKNDLHPSINKKEYTDTQLVYFLGCTKKGFELAKTKEEIRYVDSSCAREMKRF